MHFSKSLKGNKWAKTMRPVSIEPTLLLFLHIHNFLGYKNWLGLRKAMLYGPTHLFYWRCVSRATLCTLSSRCIICKILLLQAYFLQTSFKLTGANNKWQYLKAAMKQWNNSIILKPCANKIFKREYIKEISKVAKNFHSYLIQVRHEILKYFLRS